MLVCWCALHGHGQSAAMAWTATLLRYRDMDSRNVCMKRRHVYSTRCMYLHAPTHGSATKNLRGARPNQQAQRLQSGGRLGGLVDSESEFRSEALGGALSVPDGRRPQADRFFARSWRRERSGQEAMRAQISAAPTEAADGEPCALHCISAPWTAAVSWRRAGEERWRWYLVLRCNPSSPWRLQATATVHARYLRPWAWEMARRDWGWPARRKISGKRSMPGTSGAEHASTGVDSMLTRDCFGIE